ncbi:unnamed protein product [Ectocarpus sp. 12 AP-2014]
MWHFAGLYQRAGTGLANGVTWLLLCVHLTGFAHLTATAISSTTAVTRTGNAPGPAVSYPRTQGFKQSVSALVAASAATAKRRSLADLQLPTHWCGASGIPREGGGPRRC